MTATVRKIELSEAEREIKRIKRLIRKGVLPRYTFAKGPDGKLERSKLRVKRWAMDVDPERGKFYKPVLFRLTWRRVSTLEALTP